MIERITVKSNANMYSLSRHMIRYLWACQFVRGKILDLGCGDGYGSEILSNVDGTHVVGIDKDMMGVHVNSNIDYIQNTVEAYLKMCGQFGWIVMFEILEHLESTEDVLSLVKTKCNHVIGSIPYKEEESNVFHKHFNLDESVFDIMKPQFSFEFYGQGGRAFDMPVKDSIGKNLLFVGRWNG